MAESPQPAGVQEGIDADETPVLPVNAEDRRAAAALSALDRNADEEDEGKGKNVADSEALGQAMKNLAGSEQEGGGTATAQRDEKKVKVDAADVSLLVEQLELSKGKATELLKAHDGDAVKAMTSFVTSF